MIMNKEDSILDFLFFWKRPISPGNLKKKLDMKHSTLNSVINRLQKKDFLIWEKYESIRLTEKGKEEAMHFSKHHFIIEKFLIEDLKISEDIAHSAKRNKPSYIDCTLIEAICTKMDYNFSEINDSFCTRRNYYT